MNPSRIIIASNYHRHMPFFDDSAHRLYDAGFKRMVIQRTGSLALCQYTGPGEVFSSGHIPYDSGMINFRNVLKSNDYDAILFADNDCFIQDADYIKEYVRQFLEGGYDFVCHLVSPEPYKTMDFSNGKIIAPFDMEILPSDMPPWMVPNPHMENALLLISRRMYEQLSTDDVSHGRKWIKAVKDKGGKFGSHICQHRMTYTHIGINNSWFHLGNYFQYSSHIENKTYARFNPESELDLSRVGYLVAQKTHYGINYTTNQDAAISHMGGEQKCLDAWNRLTEGSCMSDWKKL